jgi:hypothetical protein
MMGYAALLAIIPPSFVFEEQNKSAVASISFAFECFQLSSSKDAVSTDLYNLMPQI